MIYNPHEEYQETLKDARFSLGSSVGAAFRGAVPFARQIMQPETFSLNFQREDINWDEADIREAMKDVPSTYRGDLLKARNKDSLMADIAGIKSGISDLQYMDEQHGFIPSMGLYMAASIVDPISWTGYGFAARVASAGKFAASLKQASTLQKAGYWGGSSAVIEGVSEAMIQYGGEKDYGSVPIAAAFGFGLAGTGSIAHSLLSTSVSARKADAVAKLSNESYTLKSSTEEAQKLVNTINLADEARPFRSTISTIVDRLTGSKSPILRSPTYRAFMKGGKASDFARLIDTPAGISKNEAGEIIPHAERTVMDEKYSVARDFLDMEIVRIQAKEKSGLDEDAFTELVWRETQVNRQRYEKKVNDHKAEIRENKELIKELRNKLESDVDEVALATRKKELKDEGLADDAITKKIEEESKVKVDRGLEREIQKRAIEEEAKNPVETIASNDGVLEMIEASSKYYGKMHNRMIDAKLDEADSMLPRYYTPIMYDTKAVKLGDDGEVTAAFEEAIRSSAAYRALLDEASVKYNELAANGKVANLEEIRKLENDIEMLEYLQNGDPENWAGLLDRSDVITLGLQPSQKSALKLNELFKKSKVLEELEKLSGISREQIAARLDGEGGSYNSTYHRIKMSDTADPARLEEILQHEYSHAITSSLIKADINLRNKIEGVMKEVDVSEINDMLKKAGVTNINTYRVLTEVMYPKSGMPPKAEEFVAVAFSNKDIALALNNIDLGAVPASKKNILSKLFNLFKESLGIKKINKGSALEKIKNLVESNVNKSRMTSAEISNGNKALGIKRKIEFEMIKEKPSKARLKKLHSELDEVSSSIIKSLTKRKNRVTDKLTLAKQEVTAKTNELSNAEKEVKRVLDYPKKAAKATVDSIKGSSRITDIDLANANPTRLKGRKLPIDVSHPSMEPYVVKNEAALAQMYNYTMGGRVASKKILGFDKPEEMRRHLMDKEGMFGEDLEMSMESFELALGTRQIPADPSSAWEKSIRMISHFNYITMGGQFAKTGMSEIGAGVYRTGFRYLGELFPALKDVIASYRGKDLSTIGNDARSIVDASAIVQNKSHSAFSDTEYIESTFAQGLERGLKKASTKFFKYSGLEGVTTMTQVALPRAFLGRIINEAKNPTAQLDMVRWGMDIEDMKAIAKQPFVRDSKGIITDFNFSEWDKGLAEKFQVVTQRMSRDAIMRPDAVRVPTWVNDGGTSPIFKLAKQFTTFTFLSNERLMLAGMNENRAMALTGTVISGAILYAAEKASEELMIAVGAMDEEDARFRDEEGQAKLASYISTRHSFAGGLGVLAETINAMNSSYGDRELATRFLGGVTASRGMQAGDATGDLMSGKFGTAGQIYFLKSMIPLNNMIGLDTFNKNIAKGLVEDARRNNYYQSE